MTAEIHPVRGDLAKDSPTAGVRLRPPPSTSTVVRRHRRIHPSRMAVSLPSAAYQAEPTPARATARPERLVNMGYSWPHGKRSGPTNVPE